MSRRGLLHRPGGATLELLQEAVNLVLDAGGRAGHFFGARQTIGRAMIITIARSRRTCEIDFIRLIRMRHRPGRRRRQERQGEREREKEEQR